MPHSPRTRAVTALVGLVALALTGCTGGGSPASARPAPTVTYTAGDTPVLLPGRPGEEAEVLEPGESRTRQNPLAFDEAEVRFVTGMVPHHAQALEMAALAPERAEDPRVLALAARIAADQEPEIASMQAWLEQNGLPEAPGDGAHGSGHGSGHSTMPGMATEVELTRLVAARGTAFDRLFLELMTRHHGGAIVMAEEAGSVLNPTVAEMVADTRQKQSVEIARMQELLADLPA